MEFRKADEKDAEKAGKLLQRCFNIATPKEGKDTFLKELEKKNEFILAQEDGEAVGLISWVSRGLPKHQLARIERICIPLDENKENLADELITAMIQSADKYFKKRKLKLRKIYAMVHSNNKKLRDFYIKKGFIEEAALKDHYYKGTDEYILSLFFE